jgi:hypothetical protein
LKIQEVHITEYDALFNNDDLLFLRASYYLANTPKEDIDFIKCFVVTYKEGRIGIIGLLKNQVFSSPYRASFGGIRCGFECGYDKINRFIKDLEASLKKYLVSKIELVFEPQIYNGTRSSITTLALITNGFSVKKTELNQFFNLHSFNPDLSYLNEKDQKNTHYSLKKNLSHEITQDSPKQKLIYDLFAKSRAERKIPLKLSWEQLKHITAQIDADFWAVYTPDETLCAGAVIYHLNSHIAQIIYWGFATELSEYDSMRYLSYQLFNYYQQKGKTILDIGISTEGGIANEGLLAFKENIGCEACLKFEFIKTY